MAAKINSTCKIAKFLKHIKISCTFFIKSPIFMRYRARTVLTGFSMEKEPIIISLKVVEIIVIERGQL